MPVYSLSSLSDLSKAPFDTVIDVRAPSEYAEDHLPGAINLPVLSDEERAKVGTIYKQVSPFDAKKIGAALVSKNAAHHLQTELADKPGGWRPMVYCWRGGQRSGSFATILEQIGWRVGLLKGGYKSYRRMVVAALYDQPLPHRFILIDGGTGTAKTRLLTLLAETGAQVIDLEGMANHRGSLFGSMGDQPSQKMFESRIAMALAAMDPNQPVFVEAESNKVGNLLVPPTVWKAMIEARRVVVQAPVAARATYLLTAYSDIKDEADRVLDVLDKLRVYHGAEQVDAWKKMALDGALQRLAADLIETHYDPRYTKATIRAAQEIGTVNLDDLSEASLAAGVLQILDVTGS